MTNTFYLIMQISTIILAIIFLFLFFRKEKTKDSCKILFILALVLVTWEMILLIIDLLLGEYLDLLLESLVCIAWIVNAKLAYDRIKEY